jgi:hypothetical protein
LNSGLNRSLGLAAACLIGAVSLLVTVAAPGGWVQAGPLLLLVLAAVGYAVSAALFPPGTIERSDRAVYSFVFALSAAAVGGLLLQFAVDLDRWAWFLLLAGIDFVACAIAWRRISMPIRGYSAIRLPAGPIWAACFLAALTIAGAAVVIAVRGVHEQQSRQRFASLWALPVDGGIEAGVWNHAGPSSYLLDVSSDGRTIERLKLRLPPGGRWRQMLGPGVSAATPSLLLTLRRSAVAYPAPSVELNIAEPR